MTLNRDTKRRAEILGIVDGVYGGGIHYVEKITASMLRLLLLEHFADPDDRQNEAPPLLDIYAFLLENPGSYAEGYVVSPDRNDYRVSIDSVHRGRANNADWRDLTRTADEVDSERAWWD